MKKNKGIKKVLACGAVTLGLCLTPALLANAKPQSNFSIAQNKNASINSKSINQKYVLQPLFDFSSIKSNYKIVSVINFNDTQGNSAIAVVAKYPNAVDIFENYNLFLSTDNGKTFSKQADFDHKDVNPDTHLQTTPIDNYVAKVSATTIVYITKYGTLNSISINGGKLKTTTIVNDKDDKVRELFVSNGYILIEYQSKLSLGIYSASNNKFLIQSIDQNLIDGSNFDHFYATKTKDGGADLYLATQEYLYGIEASRSGTIIETEVHSTNHDTTGNEVQLTKMFNVNNSVFASYWGSTKKVNMSMVKLSIGYSNNQRRVLLNNVVPSAESSNVGQPTFSTDGLYFKQYSNGNENSDTKTNIYFSDFNDLSSPQLVTGEASKLMATDIFSTKSGYTFGVKETQEGKTLKDQYTYFTRKKAINVNPGFTFDYKKTQVIDVNGNISYNYALEPTFKINGNLYFHTKNNGWEYFDSWDLGNTYSTITAKSAAGLNSLIRDANIISPINYKTGLLMGSGSTLYDYGDYVLPTISTTTGTISSDGNTVAYNKSAVAKLTINNNEHTKMSYKLIGNKSTVTGSFSDPTHQINITNEIKNIATSDPLLPANSYALKLEVYIDGQSDPIEIVNIEIGFANYPNIFAAGSANITLYKGMMNSGSTHIIAAVPNSTLQNSNENITYFTLNSDYENSLNKTNSYYNLENSNVKVAIDTPITSAGTYNVHIEDISGNKFDYILQAGSSKTPVQTIYTDVNKYLAVNNIAFTATYFHRNNVKTIASDNLKANYINEVTSKIKSIAGDTKLSSDDVNKIIGKVLKTSPLIINQADVTNYTNHGNNIVTRWTSSQSTLITKTTKTYIANLPTPSPSNTSGVSTTTLIAIIVPVVLGAVLVVAGSVALYYALKQKVNKKQIKRTFYTVNTAGRNITSSFGTARKIQRRR